MSIETEQLSTPEKMESEENLSLARLVSLAPTDTLNLAPRPTANFIDLMNWAVQSFEGSLTDHNGLNKFVHNRVIVDGQFLQFCKENKITVECLYKDSIISWKTNHDFEKFFAQGVFLIKTKGVEFLHAALFHKGNQNEDEVSFFIICSEKNYEGYVKLRNNFDEWVLERDRSNLHVRVIEGDDIPYTKDNTWEDLFLPKKLNWNLRD